MFRLQHAFGSVNVQYSIRTIYEVSCLIANGFDTYLYKAESVL
jgi:hypothetical protein